MAHCNREVFHAQWTIILDNEFMEAYAHGLVIDCCDGIQRRFYPRIFTYSADYPEKYVPVAKYLISITYVNRRIIIAGIRNLGLCPCPRCRIPKDRVANMGKPQDMAQRKTLARVDDVDRRTRVETARKSVHEENQKVDGAQMQRLLKKDSLVPTAVCTSSHTIDRS
jgi:molybdopterin/thiamine biosynthesis adenylyltransferase